MDPNLFTMPQHNSYNNLNSESSNTGGNVFVAVGIDFGTTYCGVTWALSEHPDAFNEISEWPSHYHLNSGEDQVPTQLCLDTGKWGYQLTPRDKPVKWFKLLLLKDSDIQREEVRNSEQLKLARQQLEQRGLTPTYVVGQYLARLWAHTLDQLSSRLGPENLENLPLRVAITVPAIWPHYAENAMREAAKIAKITVQRDIGATTLDLVQEPEAAALSIFLDRRVLPDIQTGESFVVCDAGGGTLDMISYTVQSTTPFRLVECVKGDGKLAGAFKVDEAFAAHLRWTIKLRLDTLDTPEHNEFVTREWEMGAKRNFAGLPETPQFFLTPPPKATKMRDRLRGRGRFGISREAMAGFFDQSLTSILALVSDQVRGVRAVTGESPKSILLVGGLGGSQYIFNQLNAQYPGIIRRPINSPWSAVARGAVIRLLQDKMSDPRSQHTLTPRQRRVISMIPEVITRKARCSYGTLANTRTANLNDFNPGIDTVNINPEGNKVTPRMKWYLKKGDDVSKMQPVLISYHQFAKDEAPQNCAFTIFSCEADKPPKRKEGNVTRLCEIIGEWDRPFNEWKPVGSEQIGWRKFDDLALAMRFPGTQPVWTMKVGSNESEHAVSVEYIRDE